MWAYRARDAVATVMHGMWGAFWIAYGLYNLLIAVGVLPLVANATAAGAFGFWFVVLAAITLMNAIAAAAENIVLTGVLVMLAAGSTLLAIALLGGLPVVQAIAAYLLIISALLAWYLASAMMVETSFKRAVLPIGRRQVSGKSHPIPHNNVIQFEAGEPGVKVGQ